MIEVWWSGELLVPRRLIARESGGVLTSTMHRVEDRVDPSELADPRTRFPSYEVADFADARDRH